MDTSTTDSTVNRYGVIMFLLLSLMLLGVLALQVVADPLAILGSGFKRFDKHRAMHSRIAKAEAINREPFDTVILGSSRFAVGFDPADPSWGDDAVFNLSLAGANIVETRQAWELLKNVHPPRRLLIDVSLFTLNQRVGPGDDYALSRFFPMERLSRDDPPTWVDAIALRTEPGDVSLETRLNWIFGLPQIRKAVGTVLRGLRSADSQRYTDGAGFGVRNDRPDDNRVWFEQSLVAASTRTESYNGFILGDDRLEMLREIVADAAQLGIQVDIVMPPVHVTQLEVIDRMGLTPAYDRIRVEIAELAERYAPDVRAWDFSGWSGVPAEAITGAADSPMQYYLESSHFTPHTGSLLLKRLYGGPDDQALLQRMGGLGVQLLPAGVTPFAQRWHAARDAWRHDNPDLMDWIDGIWDRAAPERDRRLRIKQAASGATGGMQFVP